jgi:hypothetical protein
MGPEQSIAGSDVAGERNGRGFLPDSEVAGTPNPPGRDHLADQLLGGTDQDHLSETVEQPAAVAGGEGDQFVVTSRIR